MDHDETRYSNNCYAPIADGKHPVAACLVVLMICLLITLTELERRFTRDIRCDPARIYLSRSGTWANDGGERSS